MFDVYLCFVCIIILKFMLIFLYFSVLMFLSILFWLVEFIIFLFFFFSSRRRHTRSKRDWSSDVCSSDLHYLRRRALRVRRRAVEGRAVCLAVSAFAARRNVENTATASTLPGVPGFRTIT